MRSSTIGGPPPRTKLTRRIGVALVGEFRRIGAQEGLGDAGDQRPLALIGRGISP